MALTAKDVAQRIEEAVYTLQRLPRFHIQAHRSSWPQVVREFSEAYGYGEVSIRLGPPPSKKITEMDEVLRWMLWLTPYETRLVWLRGGGARWKTIEYRLNFCIRKLQNDWKAAILTISFALAHDTPIRAREPVFSKPSPNQAFVTKCPKPRTPQQASTSIKA